MIQLKHIMLFAIVSILQMHANESDEKQAARNTYAQTIKHKYTKYGNWDNVSENDKQKIIDIIAQDTNPISYIDLVLFAYSEHKKNPTTTFDTQFIESVRPNFLPN